MPRSCRHPAPPPALWKCLVSRQKQEVEVGSLTRERGRSDEKMEKASILEDGDFELELIRRDVINVQSILTLLAKLYDADEPERVGIREVILDTVASDLELRSKRELIEKFSEQSLPVVRSAAEIPECFEDFWEKERVDAFEQLVREEQLDAEKLRKVIDRYVYTGDPPVPDPDIIQLIDRPMKLAERGPTKIRVFDKIVDFVTTFRYEMAACFLPGDSFWMRFSGLSGRRRSSSPWNGNRRCGGRRVRSGAGGIAGDQGADGRGRRGDE